MQVQQAFRGMPKARPVIGNVGIKSSKKAYPIQRKQVAEARFGQITGREKFLLSTLAGAAFSLVFGIFGTIPRGQANMNTLRDSTIAVYEMSMDENPIPYKLTEGFVGSQINAAQELVDEKLPDNPSREELFTFIRDYIPELSEDQAQAFTNFAYEIPDKSLDEALKQFDAFFTKNIIEGSENKEYLEQIKTEVIEQANTRASKNVGGALLGLLVAFAMIAVGSLAQVE